MKLFLCALFVALLTNASPIADTTTATCTTKTKRRAWHKLSRDEKLAYINAEKCLMKVPAKLGLNGTRTRFDELQQSHALQTEQVHGVGAFLPYHRFFVYTHEYLLKTECGYDGAQPYWDEAHDAGNFSGSVVLDPVTGFGGNGAGPKNCIRDGPFADYVNAGGPGHYITDHCIDRQVSDFFSATAAQQFVDQCMVLGDFVTAWPCLEALPHGAGHGGIGGQMLNMVSSPGDPIFYLHHTYLDKLWWDWQKRDLPKRLSDMGGQNVATPFNFTFPPNSTFPGFPPTGVNGTNPFFPTPPVNGSNPFPGNGSFPGFPGGSFNGSSPFDFGPVPNFGKPKGDPGDVTTLGHQLTMFGVLPNVTIGDVMDIQGGFLCYEYE